VKLKSRTVFEVFTSQPVKSRSGSGETRGEEVRKSESMQCGLKRSLHLASS
jgi:hypothetical protein